MRKLATRIKSIGIIHRGTSFWVEYKESRTAAVGLAIIVAAIFLAIAAPILSPYSPWRMTDAVLASPSMKHPMGTDDLGRDVLSRIIWGIQVSLLFGLVAAGISCIIGIFLGAVSGYYGGLLDDLLSRVSETILVFPLLFLLILVVTVFGTDVFFSMTLVGLTMWPWNARIMRAQVLSLKKRGFVRASIAVGTSNFRVLFRHIVPNGIHPIIANTTLQMAWAILTEAGLSFIGLGDTNYVSWGQILYWGKMHIKTAPWMVGFAGMAIAILVLGFVMTGDGINRALNPRLRERV